jgi:hypothetical protein
MSTQFPNQLHSLQQRIQTDLMASITREALMLLLGKIAMVWLSGRASMLDVLGPMFDSQSRQPIKPSLPLIKNTWL